MALNLRAFLSCESRKIGQSFYFYFIFTLRKFHSLVGREDLDFNFGGGKGFCFLSFSIALLRKGSTEGGRKYKDSHFLLALFGNRGILFHRIVSFVYQLVVLYNQLICLFDRETDGLLANYFLFAWQFAFLFY